MRHGLMLWREEELSRADVLGAAGAPAGGDAGRPASTRSSSTPTTSARPASLIVTGFTPYWSDALLLLPAEGQAVFATALSKRVGNWIKSTNPTAEVAHSPQPGRLVGERLAAGGARKVGVVELDHMPGGLVDEIRTAAPSVELVDASGVFASVRAMPNAAELRLAAKADAIAAAAFAQAPAQPKLVGDITEVLELNVRNAGAEECYVAIAPDLKADARLARTKGRVALGPYFAVRLSVAYNGVWIRRTESFARNGADDTLADVRRWADALAVALPLDGAARTADRRRRLAGGLAVWKTGRWRRRSARGRSSAWPRKARKPRRELPYGVLGHAARLGARAAALGAHHRYRRRRRAAKGALHEHQRPGRMRGDHPRRERASPRRDRAAHRRHACRAHRRPEGARGRARSPASSAAATRPCARPAWPP